MRYENKFLNHKYLSNNDSRKFPPSDILKHNFDTVCNTINKEINSE